MLFREPTASNDLGNKQNWGKYVGCLWNDFSHWKWRQVLLERWCFATGYTGSHLQKAINLVSMGVGIPGHKTANFRFCLCKVRIQLLSRFSWSWSLKWLHCANVRGTWDPRGLIRILMQDIQYKTPEKPNRAGLRTGKFFIVGRGEVELHILRSLSRCS